MERTEAEKTADYILNDLLSFVDKPEDAKEKVTEWFEQNCSLDSADKLKKPFKGASMNNEDAIKLKEQEAVKPKWYYGGTPFCGNCGHILQKKNRQHMKEIMLKCPKCRTAVKWE